MRHGVFGAQHDRAQIDLVLTLPVVDRVLFDEGQGAADARVVDQNRQAAQIRDRVGDDARPLSLADLEAVATGAARVRIAPDAFARAESLDGASALCVQAVGAEFDRDDFPIFKGVFQHQMLNRGVQHGALHGR